MSKRVVIVGGVAAGMKTAAASVSRQTEQLKSARLSHFTTAAELWRMRLSVFYQR